MPGLLVALLSLELLLDKGRGFGELEIGDVHREGFRQLICAQVRRGVAWRAASAGRLPGCGKHT